MARGLRRTNPMRKIGILVATLATFAAAGCSSGSPSSEASGAEVPAVETGLATAAQVRAFASLKRETSREWTWLQHARWKTPTHLSAPRTGAPTLRAELGVEASTKGFLAQHRELFKLRDPSAELRLTRETKDELSMTHARFQQQARGVPVLGAELTAHYDAKGILTSLDATYVPDLDGVDVDPRFEAKLAVDIAHRDVVARLASAADEAKLVPSEGKLVVFALGDRAPTLAYQVVVRAVFGNEPAIWVTTIDAKSGEIIDRYDNLQTVEGSGVGVLGDVRKIQVSTVSGGFAMIDTSRGARIQTHDANEQQITASQGAPVATSTSLTSWDTGVNGAGAAVDAHFNAGLVYDYYKNVHARNGIDGAGGTMVSTAHYGQSFENAFWDGTSMSYGDGGQTFKALSTGLDVVAHEFTHGVIQSTSNLRYQGQPGALNESIADIFGAFIEHASKPNDVNNWKMGELLSSTVLRDMKTPSVGRQPDHMTRFVQTQQDNGGVHINSGIPNNAAFLMTMGGVNPTSKTGPQFGVGWEKSEKVWFRANSQYLQETSNFAAAAQATMQAAKDLGLTTNEQNIVDCAWKAVGVVQGTCATIVDPKGTTTTPTTPSTEPDPTETGSTATTADEGSSATEEGDDPAPTPRKRRVLAPQESSGCSVGPSGGTDLAPLAGVALALALLARGKRKRA